MITVNLYNQEGGVMRYMDDTAAFKAKALIKFSKKDLKGLKLKIDAISTLFFEHGWTIEEIKDTIGMSKKNIFNIIAFIKDD